MPKEQRTSVETLVVTGWPARFLLRLVLEELLEEGVRQRGQARQDDDEDNEAG